MRLAGVVARTLAVAAAVLLAAVATAGDEPASGTPIAFTITGSVERLYPGLSLPLPLTVTNGEPFPIVVTSIVESVGDGATGCPGAYLTIGGLPGTIVVPARGSAIVAVPIARRHSAPDACQGAVFALSYSGQARKE